MSARLLVTWVTRYGSTEEVAHAIADDLLKQSVSVNAQPLDQVQSLDRYDAVVLGCALYMGHLHRHARRFLLAHRDELLRLPVALFVLGPFHADPKEFAESERQVKKELAQFPWFSPVALEIVGGRVDPAKLGFPFRFLPPLRTLPASDARDWTAIHTWAGNLPTALRPSATR